MNVMSFSKKAALAAVLLVAPLGSASATHSIFVNNFIPISERELADWFEMLVLFKHNANTIMDIRYALYGNQEMYTPLDKIASDTAAFADLVEQHMREDSAEKEARIQKSIERLNQPRGLDRESKIATAYDVVEAFRKHRDTLKLYRQQNAHRAVISTLLDRVIRDLSIIDVLLAGQ